MRNITVLARPRIRKSQPINRFFLFLTECWRITLELAPWLLLGALAGGALHVLLPKGWLQRQLQGPWGVVKSVLLGVPLPLCSCGVIPVGLSLKKSGASPGASVGFLISTPQTGVDSILVSATMLTWPFAIFKVAAAAATGVIGGWLTDAIDKPLPQLPVADASDQAAPERSLREFFRFAEELLQSLWRWLVIGVVASALISTFLPANTFGDFGALGDLAAMLVTLVIATPLYVCATASVPIAASLVASGLPIGAALVFLMAGPATNLATIGAVRKTLGDRALAVYLTVIIGGSIAAGMFFQEVLASDNLAVTAPHEHGPSWWRHVSAVSAVLLILLIARFAWREASARLAGRNMDHDAPTQTVAVDGMTCEGCVNNLTRALLASDKVAAARVTLNPQQAVVQGAVSREELKALVQGAGYRAAEP